MRPFNIWVTLVNWVFLLTTSKESLFAMKGNEINKTQWGIFFEIIYKDFMGTYSILQKV